MRDQKKRFVFLLGLCSVILWKGATIMPDGRVGGTIGPSLATDAGIKTGDYVVIVDGMKFSEELLNDRVRCIIVKRNGELIPILNPKIK